MCGSGVISDVQLHVFCKFEMKDLSFFATFLLLKLFLLLRDIFFHNRVQNEILHHANLIHDKVVDIPIGFDANFFASYVIPLMILERIVSLFVA